MRQTAKPKKEKKLKSNDSILLLILSCSVWRNKSETEQMGHIQPMFSYQAIEVDPSICKGLYWAAFMEEAALICVLRDNKFHQFFKSCDTKIKEKLF